MSRVTKILLIAVIVIILLVAAYFWFTKPKSTELPSSITGSTPEPLPSAFSNEQFPLNLGMQGENVRRLQVALNWIKPVNKIDEDGKFGAQTRGKLLTSVSTSLSVLPVTESNFNAIIKLGNDAWKSKTAGNTTNVVTPILSTPTYTFLP